MRELLIKMGITAEYDIKRLIEHFSSPDKESGFKKLQKIYDACYNPASDKAAAQKQLAEQKELIQCIAAKESVAKKLKNVSIPIVGLGETQSPTLSDYADGVDVIKFILSKKT